MRQLIVNADDFGLSPGVNQGILDAHHRGIVTSTTALVNFSAAGHGLERALSEAPDLGIGLHLTLTAGAPVSSPAHVPSLVDENGRFHPFGAWIARYETLEGDHVQREIAAQVDCFIRLAGRPPDHLDAHHHATYLHPAALRAMLDIATAYHIPLRSSGLENGVDGALRLMQVWYPDMSHAFAAGLIEPLLAVLAEGPAPFMPARFETGFFGARATLGDLLVILTNLPHGSLTELMCHPGYPDEALAAAVYRGQRADEVAHLTHPSTLECVEAERIELLAFADIARP